ncbi:MAG: C39 family peptidase [Sphingomicrobium sp.]
MSASMFAYPAQAERTELKVPIVIQQSPAWCWAATSSMALRLVGFPDINPAKNYQCGVVAAAFPECLDDCTKCERSLGTMTSMVGVLDRYRDLAFQMTGDSPEIRPSYVAYPQWKRITHSLDLSYPVIAGISPDRRPSNPAEPQHTVLITGYDDNHGGTGEQWVIIRDPYPYQGRRSPYASAGYPYQQATGKAELPWRVLRDRMNLTSAVFLESRGA